MSTSVAGKEVRVVHGTQPASTTTQTRGMERRPGIDGNTAGASKIWLGQVTCAPNEMGPPHHHGEAETAAYVLKGPGSSLLRRGLQGVRGSWSRRLHIRTGPHAPH